MNIKLYTDNNIFPNCHSPISAAGKAKPEAGKSVGNYDKATFSTSPETVDASGFARILAREAAVQLEKKDNQEKVARLQQQVASGTYVPNARSIAERMLNYR